MSREDDPEYQAALAKLRDPLDLSGAVPGSVVHDSQKRTGPLGTESEPVSIDAPLLVIDQREVNRTKNLLDILNGEQAVRSGKVRLSVETLVRGDYQIGDLFLSRKTDWDMYRSVVSGHFQKELADLLTHCAKVGVISEQGAGASRKELGIAASARAEYAEAVPFWRTQDTEGTALLLLRLHRRVTEGVFGSVFRRPIVYGHGDNDVVTSYASVCGIGGKAAEAIFQRYPKPGQFYEAVKRTGKARGGESVEAWTKRAWFKGLEAVSPAKAVKVYRFVVEGECTCPVRT